MLDEMHEADAIAEILHTPTVRDHVYAILGGLRGITKALADAGYSRSVEAFLQDDQTVSLKLTDRKEDGSNGQ